MFETTLFLRRNGVAVALGLVLLLIGGCTDTVVESATEPDPASLNMHLFAAPLSAHSGFGAQVIRERQLCFLPGIAADGSPFPLEDWPCEVQIVLTNNGQDIASAWIKAVVPNEYGRAVRLTFGPPMFIPCFIGLDQDPDFLRLTEQYNMIISRSGQLSMSCQFRDS